MSKKIEEILLKNNLLKREDYERALSIQKQKRLPLSRILLDEGLISEKDLLSALSENLNLPSLDLSKIKPEPSALKLIPIETARYYNVLPISLIGKTLTITTADPLNILAIDDLKSTTGYNIRYCLSTRKDIAETIRKSYSREEEKLDVDKMLAGLTADFKGKSVEVIKEEAKELPESATESMAEESVEELIGKIRKEKVEVVVEEVIEERDLLKEADQTPVVKLVDYILLQAYQRRASDIHLEPYEKDFRLRYRVDGILHEETELPKRLQQAISARLKIMSNLDITERRLPQDGRFRVKMEEKEIDYRVSVLPISFGEKVVLRALDRSSLSLGLSDLGFLPGPLAQMEKATSRPYGMILITGPTGSGKSTTLYSILNKLNTADRNIITIEDPVEYQIPGITQIAVKPEIGLTFAKGLRAILRQSPDIILIGEIRDFETADIAVKAALTGQLVLSTLHTNDAPSA
ncbi:MAG: Flp pilus assembly complex ATPase component TadA, partial [Candidatus Omnitrophica bacterium]|nr:Flp pilus assembly complex ATPase component TadA [Candidatus Omnitrophota bacterium]